MADESAESTDRQRAAALCALAKCAAVGMFVGATGELTRLGLTNEPIEQSVDKIAGLTAALILERTRDRPLFDPDDVGLVVTGVVAAMLEIYIGTLRTVTASEQQRLGLR